MSEVLVNLSFLMPKPTGIVTYAQNVLHHLKGLELTLLVGQKLSGYTCYRVPTHLTSDYGRKGHLSRIVWTQLELPRIYRRLRASLLFSPIPEAPLFSGCRFVVTVHDFIPLRFPNWRSPLTYYHRHYMPLVLRQAEHLVCNSEATARDITQFCHISAENITPIPLGYDTNHFRFLNLPERRYFLYVGRFDPHKNLHRLIDAFAGLGKQTETELWLAGSPDSRYTPALKEQVEQLGVTEKVKFLDYVDYEQLPILMNRAIALVYPSLWEGFGLPVLEAMACGTPVITSNLSSLPEVTGDAAWLINPYDVEELAAAMKAVAVHADIRSRLREQGLARARHFHWAKTGRATSEVLQQYL